MKSRMKQKINALKYYDPYSNYGEILLFEKGFKLYVIWNKEYNPIIDLFTNYPFCLITRFKYETSIHPDYQLKDKKEIEKIEKYVKAGLKKGSKVNVEQFLTHKNSTIRKIIQELIENA